jgi:hypothetical protein
MGEKVTPVWARLLEIIAGIIVLCLAVDVFFNGGWAIETIIWILGIGVIILGLILLIRGATSEGLSATGKKVNVILGIIFLAVGAAAIVNDTFDIITFVILLFALGLLLNAIGRLEFAGYSVAAGMPPSVRWANIILGVIAFILAIAAFLVPGFANAFWGLLVALVLFLFGIQLVIAGAGSRTLAMKKKMSWVTIVLIIWLVVRIIFTTLGLPSNFALLEPYYSQLRDAGSIAVGTGAIVLVLYVLTVIGVLMHYDQDPEAPPIRWGPIAGFFAVMVDVIGTLAFVGIVSNYISSVYYVSSYVSGLIAGTTIGTIFWNAILAALLYGEYKKEGQTGQQAAKVVPGRPSRTYAKPKLTFCKNCGTSVSPDSEYCEHCGKQIVR